MSRFDAVVRDMHALMDANMGERVELARKIRTLRTYLPGDGYIEPVHTPALTSAIQHAEAQLDDALRHGKDLVDAMELLRKVK